MTRQIINQNTFTSGEISPRLYSRFETDEYKKGLATATNVAATPHGPIKRRNGFRFVAEIKDSSEDVKLIRYQFSKDISYILEFGDQYVRFYTNGQQVVESSLNITGITQANPAVVTSTSHGLSNGDSVYITGVVGMTEINEPNLTYTVANVTANTFELSGIDSTSFTAYSSGGSINKVYEITSPYTEDQISELQYVQNGATLYLAHSEVAPQVLTRVGSQNWTIAPLDFYPPPTYESGYRDTGTTVTPAATTGLGVNFTAGTSLFLPGDVGRQIINMGGTGRASIVEYTSATVVVCDIIEDFPSTSAIASADWKIDLSPVVDLEFDSSAAGSIANIRSEYPAGSLGPRISISNVTKANPGVVTTSTAHNLVDGDSIQIQDITGMTEINDKIFTVNVLTSTTFELNGENTSGYTAYSSGGIVRQKLDDISLGAFRSADVGKYILANGGVMQIIAVNAADDVDAEIVKGLNSKESTGNWSLETPTWTSDRGYPRAVGFYEQRLVYGGTIAQPQSLWFSEIGIFDGFGAGPDDEDSIDIELVSRQVNQISWIANSRDLVVGTGGGELTIDSGSSSSISPSNIQQKSRTYHGSSIQQVENIKDEILFLQSSGTKIRTFRYDFNIDGYIGEDINFLAEHITVNKIIEFAYSQEPDNNIYAVTGAGNLLCGTYDRAKKVLAWSRLETDGDFKRVMSVQTTGDDHIWVMVERNINGSMKRYLELLDTGTGMDDIDGFSDSYSVLSNNAAISSISTANPAVITSTAHGFSNGDKIVIKDLVDIEESQRDPSKTNITELNQNVYTVANVTANTFELSGLNTSNFNAAKANTGNVFKRVQTISGLSYLEGKTVQVKGDGAVQPSKVVTNGSITAEVAAGEFTVGLAYTSTLVTLDQEFNGGIGSMQGQRVRWARPLLRVYRSTVPMLNGEYLPSRNTNDDMDNKVPLYSGYLEYGPLKWSNSSSLTISTSDPLPLQISGIVGTIESGVK